MTRSIWIYLLVMAGVSLLIRVLPLTLIRGQIKNRFIRSILFYLPYATLAVMTFPAILSISDDPLVGTAAMAAALIIAWVTKNLFLSAAAACVIAWFALMFI